MPLKVPSTTNLDAMNAKLHARRARLCEHERLARLCDAKSFEGFASTLYPDEKIKDRRVIQKRLTEDSLHDITWVVDYLGGREFGLYMWLLKRYQLENLKVIFRGFHSHRQPQEVLPYVVALPDPLALPAEKMLLATSTEEFGDAVPDVALRRTVRAAISFYSQKNKPFFFEASIDCAFYREALRLVRAGGALTMQACIPTVAADAAMYVIMLIVRAKHNYGLSFDEIAPAINVAPDTDIVPDTDIRMELPPRLVQRIYAAESVSAAAGVLPARFRKFAPAKVETIDELERMLLMCLYDRANAAFYRTGISMGTAFAFYYLKRIELLNLIRLAEAYHYGLSTEEMKSILIPPVE